MICGIIDEFLLLFPGENTANDSVIDAEAGAASGDSTQSQQQAKSLKCDE